VAVVPRLATAVGRVNADPTVSAVSAGQRERVSVGSAAVRVAASVVNIEIAAKGARATIPSVRSAARSVEKKMVSVRLRVESTGSDRIERLGKRVTAENVAKVTSVTIASIGRGIQHGTLPGRRGKGRRRSNNRPHLLRRAVTIRRLGLTA
jgi:hypothetical protein